MLAKTVPTTPAIRTPALRAPALRAIALMLGLALGFGSTGAARADENWDAAQAAFETCLTLFPQTRAIGKALAEQGWRYEGNDSGLRIYSRNGYRAVAAIEGSSQLATRCAVSSSRLAEPAAAAFATATAARLGQNQPNPEKSGALVTYDLQIRGTNLRIMALPTAQFGIMRGAIVAMGEL